MATATPTPDPRNSPLPISVAIVAQDEESNLRRCLASAADLAAEIVVVDAGSTDGTRLVAEEFGARVIHQDWLGYRDQKNVALGHCAQPWVLALDCDEELSAELRTSVLRFFADGDAQRFAGAWMNRKVRFLGRWITHGDWYPDRKLRLFLRQGARWGGSPEHDKIEIAGGGGTARLAGDLHHFSFRDMSHYIAKMNRFADEFAARPQTSGAGWSLAHTLLRPPWRFFRAYVLRRGFLDGFPGLWIAASTAYFTFVRHSRRFEAEKSGGAR
jgi:glycosyltransferase involved in cell wall biosynthesis